MSVVSRRQFVTGTGLVAATAALAACGAREEQASDVSAEQEATQSEPVEEQTAVEATALSLDSAAWQYNADDNIYYQLGVSYCEKPADENYEQLAIFVPGAYFEATDNGDGTFTCMPHDGQAVGDYTATTAPIVMPVNTPGYSAQEPLSEYASQATYTGQGFVYVHAGCRGRDHGAPAGVVDLKAAVRFLRASSANMAGSTDRIFTFGMSGGGAQSAVMGATGDSDLYEPYLEAIGAAKTSDAILGSMDWCPITGLDVADEAYEWMMGPTRSGLSEEEQEISDAMAGAFATYLNAAGIVDESGSMLTLTESDDGIYQAGSYYQRVVQTIETSLNDFLSDTEFPYDASAAGGGMGGFGGPRGGIANGDGVPDGAEVPDGAGAPDGETSTGEEGFGPGPNGSMGGARRGAGGPVFSTEGNAGEGEIPSGDLPSGEQPDGTIPDGEAPSQDANGDANFEGRDNISRTEAAGGVEISGTYETASDYIDALNANGEWVSYDEASNTATIESVSAFCVALKQASKSLGAFDQFDRGQGENTLFGVDGKAAHFDETLADILEDQSSSYAADYAADLQLVDGLDTDMQTRVNMYTPLYYLLPTSEGRGTSEPAKYWRIRSGINQGDTALTTELNLALALQADDRVESVDFAAVWGLGHTMAERTGSSDENFIAWVKECLA